MGTLANTGFAGCENGFRAKLGLKGKNLSARVKKKIAPAKG
jgi:hypothetical protein